jgi:HAMP domain-containing protein
MFQGGLRKQLLALTGVGILIVAFLALVAMRTFVVEAFTQQMRDGLTARPFLQARESRHRSLAHAIRLMMVDNVFLRSLREVNYLKEYSDAVQESGLEVVDDSPGSKKLVEMQRRLWAAELFDGSSRLFLNTEASSMETRQGFADYNALADLFLICDADGVVILERRTNNDSAGPKKTGKVTVEFPLSKQNIRSAGQFSLVKSQIFQVALKENASAQPIPQQTFLQYGDGDIYDVVATPLPHGKGVAMLGDRVDHQMVSQASHLVGNSEVVALVGGKPRAAELGGSGESADYSAILGDKRLLELSQSWVANSTLTNEAPATVNLGGREYIASLTLLSSTPRPVLLDFQSDSLDPGVEKAGDKSVFGRIVFLKTTAELEGLVTKQYLATLVAVLLAVGISFVIVGRLVGRLAQPLLNLASSMSKVGGGDLDVTASIAGPTEIQDAAKAFNQMIDSLRHKDTLQALVDRLEQIRKSADVTDPLIRDQAQFGQYVVARKLGGGGMATVYVGLPIDTLKEEDRVALKVIHREFAGSEEYQARFRREYEVMRSLQHPGLIQVIDAGSLNGLLYIVMEFVEGKTLADHLEGNKGLPLRDFLGLVLPLLEAMHHSHEKGIIHRDLKPENLMLTPVGIKVMDFGLAMSGDMSRITQSGSAIGTPKYMSPEQINGQDCDGRCDQYALGIIFYEMLAGRCPFDGNDVLSIVFQHLSQTPHPLSEHRPELPKSLVDVVAKMLAKEPRLRFSSLMEVRAILSQLLN